VLVVSKTEELTQNSINDEHLAWRILYVGEERNETEEDLDEDVSSGRESFVPY
jgi:hypothetical protein